MIVADCTLIAHLFIDTADTELARTVLRLDDHWAMPALWGSDFRNVLTLAASSGCSAYDAEYVALAQALRVPLVTSDQRLARLFPTLALSPGDFVARRAP